MPKNVSWREKFQFLDALLAERMNYTIRCLFTNTKMRRANTLKDSIAVPYAFHTDEGCRSICQDGERTLPLVRYKTSATPADIWSALFSSLFYLRSGVRTVCVFQRLAALQNTIQLSNENVLCCDVFITTIKSAIISWGTKTSLEFYTERYGRTKEDFPFSRSVESLFPDHIFSL